MAKNEVSPIGRFLFPKLDTPDQAFGKSTYQVTLELSRAAAQPLMDALDEAADKAAEDAAEEVAAKNAGKKNVKTFRASELRKPAPYKVITESEYPVMEYTVDPKTREIVSKQVEGECVHFKFSTREVYKSPSGEEKRNVVKVLDHQRNDITGTVRVMTGDVGRVSFAAVPFFKSAAVGAGVTLRLYAAQLLLSNAAGGNTNGSEFDDVVGMDVNGTSVKGNDDGEAQDSDANPAEDNGEY